MVKELVLVGCVASAAAVAVLQDPGEGDGRSGDRVVAPFTFISSDVVRIAGADAGRVAGLGEFIAEYAGREGGEAVVSKGGSQDGGSAGEVDVRTVVGFEDVAGAWCTVETILVPGEGAVVLLDATYPDGTAAGVGELGNGLMAFFAPVSMTRGPAGIVDALGG